MSKRNKGVQNELVWTNYIINFVLLINIAVLIGEKHLQITPFCTRDAV